MVEPETEDGRRRRRSRGPKPAKRVKRTEKINREDRLTRNRSREHWPIIVFAAAPKPGLKRRTYRERRTEKDRELAEKKTRRQRTREKKHWERKN